MTKQQNLAKSAEQTKIQPNTKKQTSYSPTVKKIKSIHDLITLLQTAPSEQYAVLLHQVRLKRFFFSWPSRLPVSMLDQLRKTHFHTLNTSQKQAFEDASINYVNSKSDQQNTQYASIQLLDAVKRQDVQRVKTLVAKKKATLTWCTLCEVFSSNNLPIIGALIRANTKDNPFGTNTDKPLITPIAFAAEYENWGAIKWIVTKETISEAICYAAQANQTELVKYLLSLNIHGANQPFINQNSKQHAVHYAIIYQNEDMLAVLCEKTTYAQIDFTKLLQLAQNSTNIKLLESVAIHLDPAADLFYAAKANDTDLVKKLLATRTYYHYFYVDPLTGHTALQVAILNNNRDMLMALLENAEYHDLVGSDHSKPSLLKWMLDNKGDDWEVIEKMVRPSHYIRLAAIVYAAEKNNTELVIKLLQAHSIADNSTEVAAWYIASLEEKQAVHYAILNKNIFMLEALLNAGAKLWMTDKDNLTPIELAQYLGYDEIVQLMAKKRIHTSSDSEHYGHVLLNAARDNKLDLVNDLLNSQASTNWMDADRNQALHHAVLNNNSEMLNWLLASKNIDLGAQNKQNFTPIELAAVQGKWNLVELIAGQIPCIVDPSCYDDDNPIDRDQGHYRNTLLAAAKANETNAACKLLDRLSDNALTLPTFAMTLEHAVTHNNANIVKALFAATNTHHLKKLSAIREIYKTSQSGLIQAVQNSSWMAFHEIFKRHKPNLQDMLYLLKGCPSDNLSELLTNIQLGDSNLLDRFIQTNYFKQLDKKQQSAISSENSVGGTQTPYGLFWANAKDPNQSENITDQTNALRGSSRQPSKFMD